MKRKIDWLTPLIAGIGFGSNAVAVFYQPDPLWHGLTALLCLVFIVNYLAHANDAASSAKPEKVN